MGFDLFIPFFLGLLALPGLHWWPLAFLLPAIFLLVTFFAERRDARIAKIRRDYSICNFARSFDYRVIDTWIIRAVFEELSFSYPIHPDDDLGQDLGIVDEDLDDYAMEIAQRTGRNLNETEANPFYDKVETVRDLVMFLQHQPVLDQRATGSVPVR